MTHQRKQNNLPRTVAAILLIALLVLAGCADTNDGADDDGMTDVDMVDPGDPMPDEASFCFLDLSELVSASASGTVGDAEVSSTCDNGTPDSQTLTVCIQTAPGGAPGTFAPSPDLSSATGDIGCVTETGVAVAVAEPTFPGLPGNNFYRLWAQQEIVDPGEVTLGEPVVNGWVGIHCRDGAAGFECLSGFAPLDDPGTDDPGSDDPGSDDPGSDDPGSDDPGSDDPGSDDPGSDDPGSDGPILGDDEEPIEDPDEDGPVGCGSECVT